MKKVISSVSCIIPFWNEGNRLFSVLDEVVKIQGLNDILCVDDASDDNQTEKIKGKYPRIKLIRLQKNVGKSGAILEGLKYINSDYILLLDADLRNLNADEISNAVKTVSTHSLIDMLILRRIKAPMLVRMFRGDILGSGERIIKKHDLKRVLENSSKGWQLESKLNLYMYKNKKSVYWFSHSGINSHWKWGLNADLLNHKKKMQDIFSIGIVNLLKLFLFFGKKKIHQ